MIGLLLYAGVIGFALYASTSVWQFCIGRSKLRWLLLLAAGLSLLGMFCLALFHADWLAFTGTLLLVLGVGGEVIDWMIDGSTAPKDRPDYFERKPTIRLYRWYQRRSAQ